MSGKPRLARWPGEAQGALYRWQHLRWWPTLGRRRRFTGLENPTSEKVAIWIWDRLRPRPGLLHSVRVAETRTSSVIYRGSA